MRSPPLCLILLTASLLGCGAAVARPEGDAAAAVLDTAATVDAPTFPDAPAMDAGGPLVDVGLRPDLAPPADTLVPVDVGVRHDVPTIVDAGPGPTCTIRATRWTIDIGGQQANFEFTMEGRWVVSVDATEVAAGDYVIEGDRVILSGERSGSSSCAPTDRGTFQLRFSPDCEQLQLRVINDDCADRGDGIDGFRFTRL